MEKIAEKKKISYDGKLEWNMVKKPYVWANKDSFFQSQLDKLSLTERQIMAIDLTFASEEGDKLICTRLFYLEIKPVKMNEYTQKQINNIIRVRGKLERLADKESFKKAG